MIKKIFLTIRCYQSLNNMHTNNIEHLRIIRKHYTYPYFEMKSHEIRDLKQRRNK